MDNDIEVWVLEDKDECLRTKALKEENEKLRKELAVIQAGLEWCVTKAWSDAEGVFVEDVHARLKELEVKASKALRGG